jgi:hypothetical protein
MLTNTRQDPERSIPNVSTEDSIQLWKGYTLRDAALVGAPLFVGLVSLMFLPEAFALSGIITAILLSLLGVVIVRTTPEWYSSWEWVSHHLSHEIEPNELHHVKLHTDQPRREQQVDTDHGTISSALAANQRTQDILDIDRVYPSGAHGPGAVQQRDGTMIGAIKIYPANLTLATGQQWRQATSDLTTFVNTLDYRVKFYYTNRPFDVDGFLHPYRNRRTDEDVQNEAALEEVLEAFLDWYPDRLERFGTTISEHYLVVGVEEPEVESETETQGIVAKLTDLPGVSMLVDDTDEDETPEAVIRGRQRDQLYERLRKTYNRAQEVQGVDAEMLDAEEHAAVISRAWTRSDRSPLISTSPAVHHEAEREVQEA